MELTRLSGGCYHLYVELTRLSGGCYHLYMELTRLSVGCYHLYIYGVDKVVRRLLPPLHGVDKVVRRLLRGYKAILLVNNLVTDLSHGFNDLQGFMYIVWKAIYAIYGGATAYRRSGNFYVKIFMLLNFRSFVQSAHFFND